VGSTLSHMGTVCFNSPHERKRCLKVQGGGVLGERDGFFLRREVGQVEGEGGDSAAVGFCPIAAHHCQINPYLKDTVLSHAWSEKIAHKFFFVTFENGRLAGQNGGSRKRVKGGGCGGRILGENRPYRPKQFNAFLM